MPKGQIGTPISARTRFVEHHRTQRKWRYGSTGCCIAARNRKAANSPYKKEWQRQPNSAQCLSCAWQEAGPLANGLSEITGTTPAARSVSMATRLLNGNGRFRYP